MGDYKELYYSLYNKITDIIEELKEIQQLSEEKYIEKECSIIDINKRI